MSKLSWFFSILTSGMFASSSAAAGPITVLHSIAVCANAPNPEANCQVGIKDPINGEKAWLSPPGLETTPTMALIGTRTVGNKKYVQVRFHYSRKVPETGTLIERSGTAWILDDKKIINIDKKTRDALGATAAPPKPAPTPKPKAPAEPVTPVNADCPKCSAHKPEVATTTKNVTAAIDETLAYLAVEKPNEHYNMDLDSLNYLLNQTGACLPPKPDPLLKDYGQCANAHRGGNNFGYDCNFVYGWKKRPEINPPLAAFSDQWGEPPPKLRKLTKKDLQAIDGLARTIWGETRGCYPESQGPKAAQNPDLTYSGGHAEMVATVTLARALLLQKERNRVPFTTPDARWQEVSRNDETGALTSPFHPLESVISKPQAYSVWNTRKVIMVKGIPRAESKADANLKLVSCIPNENKKSPAWKKAVELAAQAYMDPEKFMKEHTWSIKPLSPPAREPTQVYFYNHGAHRRLSHTERRIDRKTGGYVQDPKTGKDKIYTVIDWRQINPKLTYPGGPEGGTTMPSMDPESCPAGIFYEPAAWSLR